MHTTDLIGECENHSNEYEIYVDHSEKTFEKRKLSRYLSRVVDYC